MDALENLEVLEDLAAREVGLLRPQRLQRWGFGVLGAHVLGSNPLSLQPLKFSDRTLSVPIRPFLNLQVAWHQFFDRKVGSASIGGIRASEW